MCIDIDTFGDHMLQGMSEIGTQCAEQCKAKGWTQADAAIRANLARPVISMIERGRFTGSLKSLIAYLSVLRAGAHFVELLTKE